MNTSIDLSNNIGNEIGNDISDHLSNDVSHKHHSNIHTLLYRYTGEFICRPQTIEHAIDDFAFTAQDKTQFNTLRRHYNRIIEHHSLRLLDGSARLISHTHIDAFRLKMRQLNKKIAFDNASLAMLYQDNDAIYQPLHTLLNQHCRLYCADLMCDSHPMQITGVTSLIIDTLHDEAILQLQHHRETNRKKAQFDLNRYRNWYEKIHPFVIATEQQTTFDALLGHTPDAVANKTLTAATLDVAYQRWLTSTPASS